MKRGSGDIHGGLLSRHLGISVTAPFCLRKTVLSHGWVGLAPYGWQADTETLSRSDRIGNAFVHWSVQQVDETVLRLDFETHTRFYDLERLEHLVRRCLMLDWDASAPVELADRLDPAVAKFLRSGGGRFLRGATFFEDFVKTVCTINTSWRNTISMVTGLVRHFGDGGFPDAYRLATTTERELSEAARVGYRARIIREGADKLCQFAAPCGDSRAEHEFSRSWLLSLFGVGPYAADHLRILQCDFSRIPVDSEVDSYCRDVLGIDGQRGTDSINEYFSNWAEYRFLGYKLGRIVQKSNWIGE